MEEVSQAIKTAVKSLYGVNVEPEINYPKARFGDYATNVAFTLANQAKRSPQTLALELAQAIKHPAIAESSAQAGFVNLRLKDKFWINELQTLINKGPLHHLTQTLAKQTIVAEYSDPNPFKELHVGHLYTLIIGDAIANLLEAVGANVHRVNFGGDVGMHVARAMWGMLQRLDGENPELLSKVSQADRVKRLASAYVEGTKAYEQSPQAKVEITKLNKRIYELHAKKDTKSAFAQIYWTARQWSYDYFDAFYNQVGSKFEKYYPESANTVIGQQTVLTQLKKGVFTQSEGAIIFDGEKYGLHKRVFINSQGLPTYEAKDIGVALAKWIDYHFDRSLIITGNDIIEYLKVVNKAIEQFEPELARRTVHIPHGMVKLKDQGKMSSRKGNFIRAVDVIESAAKANEQTNGSNDTAISLGAVKYAFLKHQIGGDVIYDPLESVNIKGNSGPYIQYTYVRTQSLLNKAALKTKPNPSILDNEEKALITELVKFPLVIQNAATNYTPHLLATYLYNLSQVFNHFYEQQRIIGHDKQDFRLILVTIVGETLQTGLKLLGISAPERM